MKLRLIGLRWGYRLQYHMTTLRSRSLSPYIWQIHVQDL